jgi:hypothetical protein
VLRARARASLDEMARHLGITVADLRTLESTELRYWETGELRNYLRALGLQLEIAAVAPDGSREPLS